MALTNSVSLQYDFVQAHDKLIIALFLVLRTII